jgi:hypothetical protein
MFSMATQTGLQAGAAKGAQSVHERAIFRRWQRYRLNLPIRLILARDDGTRITDGRVNDISAGGMLLFAGIELRASDRVSVEFTLLYSGTPVRAPGIVRHRRGYNYGVEFSAQTPSEEEQVAKFCSLMQLAAGHAAG